MPKHIILTDTALTPEDVIFIARTGTPQTISGLEPGSYSIRDTSAPVSGTVTAGTPVVAAPGQFSAAQWSVASGDEAGEIVITISALPSSGGSVITGLLYRIGTGVGQTLGPGVGSYLMAGLTPGAEILVQIAPVNAVGQGGWSTAKTVTVGQNDVPVVVSAPLVSGKAIVGQTLSATAGVWSGNPSITHRWLRNGTAIGGATDLTYVLTNADLDTTVSYEETATAGGVTVISASDLVGPIEAAPSIVLPAVATVVGFGDSITSGGYSGVGSAQTWGAKVSALLGATYLNKAVTGSVLQNSPDASGSPRSNNGRGRFATDLLGSNKREMVVINYGFNDGRYIGAPSTFNVSEYRADYNEIVAGLRIGGYPADKIVIVSPWYISDAGLNTGSTGFSGQTRAGFETFVAAARDVAQEHGCWFFDGYTFGRDLGAGWVTIGDNIHPTADVQTLMANAISTGGAILNNGAAPGAVTAASNAPGAVTVTWPSTEGSGTYEVQYAVEGSLAFGSTVTTSTLSATVNGLTGGASLRFRVRRGTGPWAYASAAVSVQTDTTGSWTITVSDASATVISSPSSPATPTVTAGDASATITA